MVSPNNPFRNRNSHELPAAANPTTVTASDNDSTAPTTSAPPNASSLTPPSTEVESQAQPSQLQVPVMDDLISEELPPAYTPAPDIYHGETTIELGPRRPFQEAPRVPASYLSPLTTGWNATGRPAPPPHSSLRTQAGYMQRPNSAPQATPSPTTPLSDFAREFYAAGSRIPGQPPERASTPPGSSGRSAALNVPDDGRPTETPTPGHPLLWHGKVLVYPGGYECSRCHNTGYRSNDPTLPCMSCWDKYSRPYSGYLRTVNFSTVSNNTGVRMLTYQRPLPRFTPPQLNGSSRPSRGSYESGYPGAGPHIIPVPGGGLVSGLGRPSMPNVRLTSSVPRGAVVYRPGDPRIGGSLCWRCGGSGVTTFLIFDEMPCSVCDGLGRTFS